MQITLEQITIQFKQFYFCFTVFATTYANPPDDGLLVTVRDALELRQMPRQAYEAERVGGKPQEKKQQARGLKTRRINMNKKAFNLEWNNHGTFDEKGNFGWELSIEVYHGSEHIGAFPKVTYYGCKYKEAKQKYLEQYQIEQKRIKDDLAA